MENLPEGYDEPNSSAYTKSEERSGPPLDYVAEKLRSCLERLHYLYTQGSRDIPDTLPVPERYEGAPFPYNPKEECVVKPCIQAFQYGITSYLALNNMLGVANAPNLAEKALQMKKDDFKKWLDGIDTEGSVT